MTIGSIIYVICISIFLTLSILLGLCQQRKINDLKKENRRLKGARINYDRKSKFKLNQFTIMEYFEGYYIGGFDKSIGSRIQRYSEKAALECSKIFEDFIKRVIYHSVWDKLVTDDRTEEDNRKLIKVELKIPFIEVNRDNIEVRLYE